MLRWRNVSRGLDSVRGPHCRKANRCWQLDSRTSFHGPFARFAVSEFRRTCRLRFLRCAARIGKEKQTSARARQPEEIARTGRLQPAESDRSKSGSRRSRAWPLQDCGFGRPRCRFMPTSLLPHDWVVSPNMNSHFLSESVSTMTNVPAPRIAYSVGGISFGMSSNDPDLRLALDGSVLEFETAAGTRCDVEVNVSWTDGIPLPNGKAAFDSGGLWSAYSENGGTGFYFQTDFLGAEPYKYGWFSGDYSRGRVLLLRRYFAADVPVYPLEYPLDELLMIHRISRGEGIEVHACGVVMPDGVGRLFIGHSGAGKSTTSRLWMAREGASVLSDDRIILRMANGTPFMYGTPWHGDAGLAAQASARVDRIYLLEHSP